MKVFLIRHAQTSFNAQRKYQGSIDIPASEEGLSLLHAADTVPDVVFITNKQRTRQTAEKIFPGAKLKVAEGLEEMCFGSFEGHDHNELMEDPDYRSWLDSGCSSPCPGGESRESFADRIENAFSALIKEAESKGMSEVYIVAHGGTQMALLERFGKPSRKYHEWLKDNGAGYILDASEYSDKKVLKVLGEADFGSKRIQRH